MARFSANLGFLWPDRPLLQRIDAASTAGFRAVELHWPFDVPPGAVRAACARHGMTLLGVNTGVGRPGEFGLGALPGREADFQARIDEAIDWCRAAGGTSVHAMAGVVPSEERHTATETFVTNLRIAAEKAGDLVLLLEPINQKDCPGYFYSTVEPALEIMARVGAPNVKLMFDCYHIGISEGDVLSRLELALPHIGHVQIAATPTRHEPDDGQLDYRIVFDVLDRCGYAGWVGCEYKPRADTDAGLIWVDRLGVAL